jgi:hypothetical protein
VRRFAAIALIASLPLVTTCGAPVEPTTSAAVSGCTIVIPGTFSTETSEVWWRLDGGFVEHLDEEVGTVWRIVDPRENRVIHLTPFAWASFRPRGRDLPEAGLALARNLEALASNRPPSVDIIAHSHGGNVLVHALTKVAEDRRDDPNLPPLPVRTVVFLSTPHIVLDGQLRNWPSDLDHPLYAMCDQIINLYSEEDMISGAIASAVTRGEANRLLEPFDIPRATDIEVRTDVGPAQSHRVLHSNAMAHLLGKALRGELPWDSASFPRITDGDDHGESP